MGFMLLQAEFGNLIGSAAGAASGAVQSLAWDYRILGAAILLIVATVLVILFIKKIVINSVLGVIVWAIAYFVFGVKLPVVASFVVSIIFGPAGMGVMLLLAFFGVI